MYFQKVNLTSDFRKGGPTPGPLCLNGPLHSDPWTLHQDNLVESRLLEAEYARPGVF